MDIKALTQTAQQLCQTGQGILAADESNNTMGKRLANIGRENTVENRRDWRDLMFTSHEAMSTYISGVILYEETLNQHAEDHQLLRDKITQTNTLIGIKVDKGIQPLALCPDETITEGLDGLAKRLEDFAQKGAKFAKWRAVISIKDGKPSSTAIHANAEVLARYAFSCQQANIVPIVEPEIIMNGTHSLQHSYDVTHAVLTQVFEALAHANVYLEGIILKPNMVIAGLDAQEQASVQDVAKATLAVLKACVPTSVPAIAFLSGGQSEDMASAHLNAINIIKKSNPDAYPWALTFSYGRALQAQALKQWSAGKEIGQSAFTHRAYLNSQAAQGLLTNTC